ncbi:MAG TPA: hypothetical protein VK943_04020 [Arenibaculum sp.]|nr:hypothetical protein [Arenibaculum sp.]
MLELTYLFVFVASVALLLVFVALRWARSGLARVLIVALFAMMLPAAYAAPAALLGKAKPVTLEWLNATVEEASVLSATLVEGEAIYVTLLWHAVPGLYKLPWDRDMAEELQRALREAQRNGTNPMMRLPFEPSWDRSEPRFYAIPQPKLPDKPGSQEPDRHFRFEHPGQAA